MNQVLVQDQTVGSSLPVIQRPIDNTALSAYMACPREFSYSMLQHRRPAGKSAPLVYGSAWHTAMEYHYKSGGNVDLVNLAVRKTWEGHDSPDDHRTLERCLLDYAGYIKKYGADPLNEDAQTVGYPDAPLVELSVNAKGDNLLHPYAGKIDRIIELNGLLYVEDHKTTSRLDKYYFSQYENSNQMMGYVYLANLLVPGRKVVGVRINVLHVLKGLSNYERQIITYSPSQLDGWEENTNSWLRRMARDIETDEFPGHYGDNGCSRKYGMCSYHRVCSASPRIREKILEQEFDIHEWNPLTVSDDDSKA